MEDVLNAFHGAMQDAQRDNDAWVCIGLDGHGRNVEIIYKVRGDSVLIYYAMTPPTKKLRHEIEAPRRQR